MRVSLSKFLNFVKSGTYSTNTLEFSRPNHWAGEPAKLRMAYFSEMAVRSRLSISLSGASVLRSMQNWNEPMLLGRLYTE